MYLTTFYNLDMIIALGYRVRSITATRFRQWATLRLKEYITKGFTLDDDRLKKLGGGGYWKELLERIRKFYPEVPCLFLTAKDSVDNRIEGLAAGADDYVTKPFSMEEVMIRLHRLVQRSGVAAVDDAELVVGDLILNQDTREVSRGGDPITLTATQFDLLRYLMENAKRVVSKSQILDNVWNYDFGGQANIVELYISYLRKKIDVGREPMIHTVRGAGYVIRPAV
mgnify:CR=1 FL=1